MIEPTNQNHTIPIQQNQRIHFLDVLRGIAIQCIFMANIVYFSGLFFFSESYRDPAFVCPSDGVLGFISFLLIDGKFYSIFSLLFGIGCFVQYHKLSGQNKPFAPFFAKRMFWLMVFGLIHLIGFWLGDILTLYALLGFAIIPFINVSNKKLLMLATILILLPILNWFIISYFGINYPDVFHQKSIDSWQNYGFPQVEWDGKLWNDVEFELTNKDWSAFFKMNLGNSWIRLSMILEEGRVFKVFGIFLIGLWAGRKILNENLLQNVNLLKKIALYGLLLGLPMSGWRAYLLFLGEQNQINSFLNTLSYALGTVPTALGYAALIALLFRKKPKLLIWLAPAGKMAFTNYILHTVFGITFFYGIGFGWAGKMGFTMITLIAIAYFLLQVVFSTLYLNYFKYGPLEWLWRQLTYGKFLKIRKS
ncbi:DUF418 domain-containing protein [Winogradskyella helgolandensis]|uniref:DUF418 domain-containing protein n=1 Tax=Winogradskyella helgolandensis TaxID=2697010 RepID=UPI0015B808CD|nr:DUF418 domain-containing protein [Winogradskyella helgolandensis]